MRILSNNYVSQGINRTLLSWLKLWDEAVFGRPAFSTPKGGGRKGEERGQKKGANLMGKGKNFENATRVEYRDPTAFASSEVGIGLQLASLCSYRVL